MSRRMLSVQATLGLALFAGCNSEGHWSYEGETGPALWAELSPDYALCKEGLQQTPINLSSATQASATPEALRFNYLPVPLQILNNGHTVQVQDSVGGGFTVGASTYTLAQLHFHSPSEHTVDGKSFDLEMHLVHKAGTKLAVVGLLFNRDGDHDNAALKPIWDNLPKNVTEEGALVPNQHVDLAALLPAKAAYFRYPGSLTTPPCSEGVDWFVLDQVGAVSDAQVDAFRTLMNISTNRPVQPLHDRVVAKVVP